VTKYSTIPGIFQQPWPGVSPTTILNEEKALGTRLVGALPILGQYMEAYMRYWPW